MTGRGLAAHALRSSKHRGRENDDGEGSAPSGRGTHDEDYIEYDDDEVSRTPCPSTSAVRALLPLGHPDARHGAVLHTTRTCAWERESSQVFTIQNAANA